jgi:hypothetical protein
MTKQWLLSAVILGALFAVVIAFWLYGQFKLRRMRSLRCPVCHGAFSIPSLSAAQRWVAFDAYKGGSTTGFCFHCDQCAADYRFTDDLRSLGRVEQKT